MAEEKANQARKLCYERRAACIIKKAMELQILCGLKIGVVILSPDGGKLESWPPELNDVKALLHACKERPAGRVRVKSEKRKEDPREILVSKLQVLNQREEFFKGKEIATTSQAQGGVRSKKRKEDFREQGCLESLNSKLQLLKNREMEFLNPSAFEGKGKEIVESLCDCDDVLPQRVYDDEFFFKFEEEEGKSFVADQQNSGGNTSTFKATEIATMEPNQWHHGSSSSVRFETRYPQQNSSFTALGGNGLPATAGELQLRKKARLQYPTAAPALNNNLPLFTPAEYWETVLTNAGLVNSSDAMLSLLEDI